MKAKHLMACLAGVALLGFTLASYAAVKPGGDVKGPVRRSSARPPLAQRVHDVGTFWSAVSNYGNYGDPNANLPSGEWPGGSEVYYIWEGRFWIAAVIGGEPRVSHADYGNYEFDPTDGSSFYFGNGPKSIQDGWVIFDDMTDYQGHTPIGFEISQRSLAWSLSEYDDFIIFLYDIKNVSGGVLNQAYVSWVFDNDVAGGPGGDPDQPHIDDLVDYDGWTHEGENEFRYDWVDPLDLDQDGNDGYDYWGWPLADKGWRDGLPRNPYLQGYDDEHRPENFDPEPDGVYDEYQIYQVENGPVIYGQPGTIYEGEVLGWRDADGTVVDTLRGYLLSRNMSYMFDGDYSQSGENDTGERNTLNNGNNNAGFIGTRLLYIPQEPFYDVADEDTMPRPLSHQWWNWESDPGSDREKYEYMTGTHSASDGKMFLPHPFDYRAGAPVFDYRYMITSGPYNNWQDGEVKKFVMVTGVGWGLKGLRENLDNAMVAYYTGEEAEIGDPWIVGNPDAAEEYYGPDVIHPTPDQVGFTGTSNVAIAKDKHFLLPIPPVIPDLHYSAGSNRVNLVWDESAEKSVDSFLGTIDFEGYKIYRSKYNAQNWQMVAAFDKVDGPVFLKNSEGQIINPIKVGDDTLTVYDDGYWDAHAIALPDSNFVMVDLPDLVHLFSDQGGSFYDVNNILIFRDIERPINGLKYFYTVAAYDPDKPSMNLLSIESARSNYRKTLDGAPDPVIPRPDAVVDGGSTAGEMDESSDNYPVGPVDQIKVVPNPYKGTALFESQYEDRIAFFYLPPRCKISIFSMTGDLVDEIYHSDATNGAEYWDLISRNNQKVVSGLYIYVVETPDGRKKVGKFLIIR